MLKNGILVISENTSKKDNRDETMSRYICRIVSKTNGKVHGEGGAAKLLGINLNTFRNRIKKLGMEYGRKGRD